MDLNCLHMRVKEQWNEIETSEIDIFVGSAKRPTLVKGKSHKWNESRLIVAGTLSGFSEHLGT